MTNLTTDEILEFCRVQRMESHNQYIEDRDKLPPYAQINNTEADAYQKVIDFIRMNQEKTDE